MVDNEKVKKVFDECWEKNGGIWYADIYKDDLKQIAKWFLMSGYSARDKEAEEEKRELVEGLINAYKEKNIIVENTLMKILDTLHQMIHISIWLLKQEIIIKGLSKSTPEKQSTRL